MQCPQCGKSNEPHYMFCLGCGARVGSAAPAGEPGGAPAPMQAWPGQAQTAPSRRCGQCGGGRLLQGAVGPQLGVRVYSTGRHDDVPMAPARVCVDCGHVALFVPDDARAYLSGLRPA